MQAAVRRATVEDADELFALRRASILALAPAGMPQADAMAWAFRVSPDGMREKLSRLEIWIAETGRVSGWMAVNGDKLEGLYVAPDYAGRGIGAQLLGLAEQLLRSRGLLTIRTEASANAVGFYLRQGFEPSANAQRDGAWNLEKRLAGA